MKTSVLLSFLVVFCAHSAVAQVDVKAWTRLPGSGSDDEGFAVAVDNFGNAIVAGATQGAVASGNAGRYDMWVAKYNSAGTQLWARQRGTSQREFAYGVAADPAGNIYTAGYAGAALDGQPFAGNFDIYLMKHDSAGSWQWTKEFGFANDDIGWAVATDRFGYIYITGSVRGALGGQTRPGTADVFIRKYDANGTNLWTRLLGSPDVDEGYGIACDSAGNVFVTGYCQGIIDVTNTYLGNGDNFLAKYDTDGNRLWLKEWGTFNKDTGNALATDAAGNVYLAGYTTGALYSSVKLGERDLFFAKFDPAGNLLWGQQMGTSGHDEAYGIATAPSGDVYVAGKVSGNLDAYDHKGGEDIYLMKYDSAGNWRETFQYGTVYGDFAKAAAVNTNGTIFIAGTTYTNLDGQPYGGGASDGFISKFELSLTAKPCAPKSLAATAAKSNSFTANWLIPQSATGCRLDVSTNFTFTDYVTGYQNLDVSTETNLDLTGLTPKVMYFYRLRAYNAFGTSSNSLTKDVTLAPANSCHGLLNSDFERGFAVIAGDTVASGWSLWEEDAGVVATSDETALVHGGAHAQRISVSSTSGTEGGIYQRINVTAGNIYTVSAWIYAGDDLSSCSLGVDPSGNTNANNIVWTSATTNVAWVQKSWTGTATAHALTVYFRVVSSDGVLRTGYFDDATPVDLALPPPLAAQFDGNLMTLSWSECNAGRLERTDTLSPPNWSTATNQVTVVAGQKTVTIAPTENSAFFRLVSE